MHFFAASARRRACLTASLRQEPRRQDAGASAQLVLSRAMPYKSLCGINLRRMAGLEAALPAPAEDG
jgi:hypothetical protein